MQALPLSNEQRAKLLEMIQVLFPEDSLDFGGFYTSECGGEYEGLDYLDVTHTNHKIPYKKYHNSEPTGFVNNLEQGCFEKDSKSGVIKQGDTYCEIYVEGIHWFEFITNHLLIRLVEFNLKGLKISQVGSAEDEYDSHVCNLINWRPTTHPIDYIYTEFKKL